MRKTDQPKPTPGFSLQYLVGCIGNDLPVPIDLSVRHDELLYGPAPAARGDSVSR